MSLVNFIFILRYDRSLRFSCSVTMTPERSSVNSLASCAVSLLSLHMSIYKVRLLNNREYRSGYFAIFSSKGAKISLIVLCAPLSSVWLLVSRGSSSPPLEVYFCRFLHFCFWSLGFAFVCSCVLTGFREVRALDELTDRDGLVDSFGFWICEEAVTFEGVDYICSEDCCHQVGFRSSRREW